MKRLQAAGFYFLLVFGAGFMLGTVRVLFIVPAIGERAAELLEMPLMLVVVALAARFIVRKFAGSIHGTPQWLHVGAIAFACMLTADVGVGVTLRGMTVWQALFERDPLSGTAYYLALVFLALAPSLFARAGQRSNHLLSPEAPALPRAECAGSAPRNGPRSPPRRCW